MKKTTTTEPQPNLRHALSVGAAWVADAQASKREDEMRQASDAFLKLAEMAFESGITVGDLHIEPGSAVDGRALSQLVKALRQDSKPSLHVVKSNSET